MKKAERVGAEKVCIPVIAHYVVNRKTKQVTRTNMDCGEITIRDLAVFLAEGFGMDVPENTEGRNAD